MKTKKLFFILAAVFIFLLLPVQAAFAISNGDISIAPEKASDPLDPRTQSWFIYTLGAGQSIEDNVYVKNESEETKTLKLYAVDAYTTPQGGFALHNENDPKEHVGKWISLGKTNLTLQPGESASVSFHYETAANAEPGEYAGGIVAEDSKPIQGKGIAVVKRVGVRVYHTVPGERNEKLNLISFEMKEEKNSRWFEATVENVGNVTLAVMLKERITANNGKVEASLQSDEQSILPKSKVTLKTNTWKEPLFGSFAANGGVYKADAALAATPAQRFFIINPLFLAAVIAIVIIAIVLIALAASKKKKKKRKK